MLLWGALAGIVGALATIAFRDAIRFGQYLIPGVSAKPGANVEDSMVELAKMLPWYWRIALPALGGIIAGGFVLWARRSGARTVYVGPEPPLNAAAFTHVVSGKAGEVLPGLFEVIA